MNNPIATIEIKDFGTMTFELFMDVPNSTANFVSLANQKFYDGLILHRIIPDFVAQGGCPDGTGMGGPGYCIDGEFANNGFDNVHSHEKGALAWARSMARNSAGSQFYMTLSDTSFLDADYAVFGKIITGEEILDKLNAVGTQSGTPTKTVTINHVSVDLNGAIVDKVKKVEK